MWTNWSGGQRCRPVATARPLDEAGVAGVIRRAAQRGQTVRPVGAGHGFSDLAVTDGVHLDCSAFSGITGVSATAGGSAATVRVRGGTTVGELQEALAERGLALPVPLDVGAPTLGGALAVGAHGSASTVGSIAEQVIALRLVDGRGEVRDVPRADLDAARTALGALGVVLDAELLVVPAAPITVTRAQRPVDEVLDPAFWEAHDLAEAALFPSSGTALARWAGAAEGEEPERGVGVTSAGATGRTALGGAVVVERALPRLAPSLNRVVSRLARTVSATGAGHRVLSDPPAVRYEQAEWAVPRELLVPSLRDLLPRLADGLETGLPVRMRVGPAERGWLHPAYGRDTGWVAVRIPRGTDPGPVLARTAAVLRAHGGRPHWGTRHDFDAVDVAAAYPRSADFGRVRDDYDPDRVFTNPALSRLLGD
ncbi:D-arabinono-1,4-lactone oxidase [Actinomycetospora termitidis]|uniref:D-arabinono-1,4-lactone oxidase n=1 Tax=Actinomycetospora termitidis TaxID=3053470 RepID=A0ABT7M2L9_9PSEU|nr:D-arabinono-1,4-lactone oxidase [Actinomycetospora sp. Odt1-22]MDL5154900.1 D-arabinono-1,4-lactone oxidase [Actinomycetospora sp. Odt1-22]